MQMERKRKLEIAVLIQDKRDFKTKNRKGKKEKYYTIRKGSIQEEDITIVNVYIPKL